MPVQLGEAATIGRHQAPVDGSLKDGDIDSLDGASVDGADSDFFLQGADIFRGRLASRKPDDRQGRRPEPRAHERKA